MLYFTKQSWIPDRLSVSGKEGVLVPHSVGVSLLSVSTLLVSTEDVHGTTPTERTGVNVGESPVETTVGGPTCK